MIDRVTKFLSVAVQREPRPSQIFTFYGEESSGWVRLDFIIGDLQKVAVAQLFITKAEDAGDERNLWEGDGWEKSAIDSEKTAIGVVVCRPVKEFDETIWDIQYIRFVPRTGHPIFISRYLDEFGVGNVRVMQRPEFSAF